MLQTKNRLATRTGNPKPDLTSIGEELSVITSEVDLIALAVLGLGDNFDCQAYARTSRAS